jgi:hypothetical protein
VALEQIETSAVHGHRRGVRQIDAVLRREFQALVFAFWKPQIGFEQQPNRRAPVAGVVGDARAELQDEG